MANLLPYRHSEFAGLIGAARRDITPPAGIFARSWGAAEHDVATGIHRPLTCTVLTLQARAGDSPLVLAALDLGWWRDPTDEWFIRSGVIEALEIDPARVMINLSHTHSGPAICRADSERPGGALIAGYLEMVRAAVIDAAREALATRQTATLTWAYGKCSLATNRDLPDPDRPRIVCGFNSDGVAEDTLLVGRVVSNGRALATLVNYACHPTTLAWQNTLISPDFVGAMRETVEAHTGNAPCLFLQGASGELAAREQYTADTAIPDAHGRSLGYAALSVLENMLPPQTQLRYAGVTESGAPLASWRREAYAASSNLEARCINVELPLKNMPTASEIGEQLATSTDLYVTERLRRQQRVRLSVGDGTSVNMPLWVCRVGDAILVGQANEAYSHLQREMRAAFPERAVSVTNVTNGWYGYLAPQELYDEDIYQVWQSPFERGSLERVIEAAKAAIGEMV